MTTRDVAIAYFDAWQARDFDRFRALLTENVTWEGPTWSANNADECMAVFHQASGVVARIEVIRLWVDGDDALTWFEVHRGPAHPYQ